MRFLLIKWMTAYCGAMLIMSATFAAPTVTVQDVAAMPQTFSIETLFEGNNGEIFGLIGKTSIFLGTTVEQRLIKIDAQGQYSELLAFTDDRVLSSLKGLDNRLYLLIGKPDSYKLYRYDTASSSQLELVYDFGPSEPSRVCPVNNTAPEYLYQKSNGVFVVAFRHDAGLPEILGQCSYGAATLDLSGSVPVYKQLYEAVPSVDFAYHNTLAVKAIFEQQGKFYTLFYKGGDNTTPSSGFYLQEITPSTNPPQENMIVDSLGGYSRDRQYMSVLDDANNRLYGLKATDLTTLDGTSSRTSVLFNVDTASNPIYNPLKTLTSSISLDENNQFVYSRDYPNVLGDFVKADGPGNYFFGTHDTGLTEGKLLFRLDNTGLAPVYYEYPEVRIPLQSTSNPTSFFYSNLMLFANNAFYGEKLATQVASNGNAENQSTLIKVAVAGVELLPPANTAPVAVADVYKICHKGKKPVTIAAPGLLKNDTDAEGDKLSIVGADVGKPRVILVAGNGKVEIFNDGRMVYTPPKVKPTRVITFSYQTTDGKAVSNSAVVTLNIKTD